MLRAIAVVVVTVTAACSSRSPYQPAFELECSATICVRISTRTGEAHWVALDDAVISEGEGSDPGPPGRYQVRCSDRECLRLDTRTGDVAFYGELRRTR